MVLLVKEDWEKPISAGLIRSWHAALLANDPRGMTVGDFRSHSEPMRVVRRNAYGEIEIRFEAPPSASVPEEIAQFVERWNNPVQMPEDIALKCAMLHPHFESIHPFEDGNGRVGRALVAKTLAEGLGKSLVLPVSAVIDRHRKEYYDLINLASMSLDWTEWAKFFIPVLTETMTDYLSAADFVRAKGEFLSKFESRLSERAKKVIMRMFRDGVAGVAAGLSAAKWVRMAKVSKPTATRDLKELVDMGAIIAEGAGAATRYALNFGDVRSGGPGAGNRHEPIGEPIGTINGTINDSMLEPIFEIIKSRPGISRAELINLAGRSRTTVARLVAVLVNAGRIEHRGSRKSGGYFAKEA